MKLCNKAAAVIPEVNITSPKYQQRVENSCMHHATSYLELPFRSGTIVKRPQQRMTNTKC